MKKILLSQDEKLNQNQFIEFLKAEGLNFSDAENIFLEFQKVREQLSISTDNNTEVPRDNSYTVLTMVQQGSVTAIISSLAQTSIPDSQSSSTFPLCQFPTNPQLKEVFEFIEANYHKSIGLRDVAQAVGYSSAYLTDLVRRQTGQTVNHWIIRRRMAAACSLLLETNQSVEQIAMEVGYNNPGHFFQQFRHHHKTTPQVWRKTHRDR
jgi:AraC-like DNA-binding protein